MKASLTLYNPEKAILNFKSRLRLKEALILGPSSGNINSRVTSKMSVGIFTFKICLTGVYMALFSFIVIFNVILISMACHYITSLISGFLFRRIFLLILC